jgi:hypothetical protein
VSRGELSLAHFAQHGQMMRSWVVGRFTYSSTIRCVRWVWSIPSNWSTVDESRSSLSAAGSVPGVDSGGAAGV